MAKLFKIIHILFKCKLDFKKVKKEKILLFDTLSLELVSKFKKFEVLDVRYKVFNFWILLENFLKLKFTFNDYILTFISNVNPKIVLTYNDNYLLFYELKNYFPNIKFIAVQNGCRHKVLLNEYKKDKKKRWLIDYLFTFGKNSEIFYRRLIIKCNNFISLGSFRNNSIKLINSTDKKNILYISTFRLSNYLNKNQDYNIESQIIKILNIFCEKKKIKLFVATASKEYFLEEKKFLLSKLPEKHNVRLIMKKSQFSNYSLINKFETIVFDDSTLGYEAIVRKKKIVAISCRKENGRLITPFGWPTFKNNKGFFFTNFGTKKEILRVINNVYGLSRKKWLKNYQKKLGVLMSYDQGNIKLEKIIKKLI